MVRGWFRRRNHRHSHTSNSNSKKFIVRFFSYNTLRIATNNFSTLLGHGGYGSVFKGVLPEDGRPVAIKKLDKPDRHGFLEKVEFMSHLRHINVIQVIGCCVENDVQLIVYEFAENGSLSHRLHSRPRSPLNWERRAAICLGTARGLLYLHEEINPRIIHRDMKPSNILLDSNFVPKISDFDLVDFVHRSDKLSVGGGRGVAKGRTGLGDPNTEDSLTTIKGTMGYMAPDYFIRRHYTEKVDVYGFGLVMLEIITGRKTVDLTLEDIDDRMILNWVTRMKKDGMVLEIVDPMLIDFPKEDVKRFINVALLCTQATPEERPSMFEVLIMLYGRHKSDQEISEMAMRAVTETVQQWSDGNSIETPVSTYSLTDSMPWKAEIQARGEMDEAPSSHNVIVPNGKGVSERKGKLTSKAAALEPVETRAASCSTEEQSFAVTDVSMYFHKSIQKIMKSQVVTSGPSNRAGRRAQTTVIKKYSDQVSMEAVYPPFLSGEYRPSRPIF